MDASDAPPFQLPPDPVPLKNRAARFVKRFERAALEVTNFWRPARRREALARFEKKWTIQARQFYVLRLATQETQEEFNKRGWGPIPWDPGRLAPESYDLNQRAAYYQRCALANEILEKYCRPLRELEAAEANRPDASLPSGRLAGPNPSQ